MTSLRRAALGVRSSAKAVTLMAVLIVISAVVFTPLAFVLSILFTPVLIETVFGGPHTFVSAWRAAVKRVPRYALWLIGTAVAIAALAMVAIMLAAAMGIWHWTVEAGLAYVGVIGVGLLLAGVLASLLSTAAAIGFSHPWATVKAAFTRGTRTRPIATLVVVYVTELALVCIAFLLSNQYGSRVIDGFEQAGGSGITSPQPAMWAGIFGSMVAAALVGFIVKPIAEAAVLGAPAVDSK